MSSNLTSKKPDKSLIFVIVSSLVLLSLVIGLRVYEFKKYDEPIALSPYSSLAPTLNKITVNINTADLNQLCELPQIGEVLAQRIIDYREQNGAFNAIDDIKQVKGIGDVIFADISSLITV